MKKIIIIIVAILIFAFAGAFAATQAPTTPTDKPQPQVSTVPTKAVMNDAGISYQGKEGVDALTLLKENNEVEQNASGLVTTIAGRKAEDSKREYWAFYINGKMAAVGPADYVTKDTDKLEWKVDNY